MPFIEHRFGKTYYQRRGSKKAPGLPLVCLHGGPGGHSRYMTDLFELSCERRVFIYDQIGGGRSSATNRSRWTINTFVNELKILIKAWELDEFHLFGGSWGTTLGLEYYLATSGKKVRSLVFQSPLFSTADWERDAGKLIRGLPREQQKVIKYCHEIGATDSKVYEEAMKAYYANHVCRNKQRLKRMFATPNPNGGKIYQHMWGPSEFKATGTLRSYNKVSSLKKIACPVLVICGEHDEARPATGKRYSRSFRNGSFAEIRGASHAILAEKPKQLTRTIGAFISQYDQENL